jgi:hypothetical protein
MKKFIQGIFKLQEYKTPERPNHRLTGLYVYAAFGG